MNMHKEYDEAKRLYKNCLTLTKELLKFINKGDVDTFMELVSQRGEIIDAIKELGDTGFLRSDEGEALIRELKPLDMQVTYKARAWLVKSRRQTSAVKAYDLTSSIKSAGLVNREY